MSPSAVARLAAQQKRIAWGGIQIECSTYGGGLSLLISADGSRRGTFSSSKGLNTSGSVSPSGEWVVLTLSKDGNPEIYLMSKDGKQSKRLTNNQAIDTAPSWSPTMRRRVQWRQYMEH